MKKHRFLLSCILLLALAAFAAGCGGGGGGGSAITGDAAKTLSSIALSKTSDTLQVNRVYDLSAIVVTATYTDNTSAAVAGASWSKVSGRGTLAGSAYTATSETEEASFTATYSDGTVSKSASFAISVTSVNNVVTGYFGAYTNASGGVTGLYFNNGVPCPVQIETLIISSTNMTPSVAVPSVTVVGASQKDKLLLSMTPIVAGDPASFNYSLNYYLGDPDTASHDDAFEYCLPYESGTGRKLTQGYNGAISHSGAIKYSLDFEMPEGTKVCAARDGVVVALKEDSNQGGPDASYYDKANYVIVYHSDGTFSQYVHLRQYGSAVNIGDRVSKGQLVGYSGNTGQSTGPHLHFMIQKPVAKNFDTVAVKMLTAAGASLSLAEGTTYVSVR